MPLAIRKAEPQDLEALGKLGEMLMRTHYEFDRQRFLAPRAGTERAYAAFLGGMRESGENCIFVATDERGIVGYVFAALEPLSWKELRGPAGFIHDVAVAEEARHSGVGTKLMQAAIDWLREHGAPRVVLMTAAPNKIAQAMFQQLGFRDTMIEMTMEL